MSHPEPDFSIVTPCFNARAFLPRCCASVADQPGVRFEHLVMDGRSTDGSVDWLRTQPGILWASEPDRGMYDAVNKGMRRARGRICAYLSADEQYLPGTLDHVLNCFAAHPDCDFVYGDMLLVRPDGSLIAYRKSYPLRAAYVQASHLYVPPCTMFFRRRIFDEGALFSPEWRDVGDADFITRLLRRGCRAYRTNRYLAAFTLTGANMSTSAHAQRERGRLLGLAPLWIRLLRHPINIARLAEKVFAGAYCQGGPITYSLYTDGEATERRAFVVRKASFRWKNQA